MSKNQISLLLRSRMQTKELKIKKSRIKALLTLNRKLSDKITDTENRLSTADKWFVEIEIENHELRKQLNEVK